MTFMQDCAPYHKSSSTSEFLDNKKDWPAQSPDLNIIENMWAGLKKRLSKYHPIQKENLWEVIEKEWYLIPNDYVIILYKYLPRRINHVMKNKGLHLKYKWLWEWHVNKCIYVTYFMFITLMVIRFRGWSLTYDRVIFGHILLLMHCFFLYYNKNLKLS